MAWGNTSGSLHLKKHPADLVGFYLIASDGSKGWAGDGAGSIQQGYKTILGTGKPCTIHVDATYLVVVQDPAHARRPHTLRDASIQVPAPTKHLQGSGIARTSAGPGLFGRE